MSTSLLSKGPELYLIVVMVFGFGSILPSGAGSPGHCINKGAIIQNPADGVCGNMDIRNQVRNFRKLENCTVIEGFLRIMFINMLMDRSGKELEDYSFPLLREITDYLIVYRVSGLKSLRHLFPNLAVIRGRELFFNFAIVAFEMRDLEELGLVNLRVIMRGAVRLSKNKKLCYIDTIDWGRIATGVEPSDHHLTDNKDTRQCVDYCPESCPTTVYNGVSAKRCWTGRDCQKNINCMCSKNASCMGDGTRTCCHEYCLGGCTGPGADECLACKGVVIDGKCQLNCTPGTYEFATRRCLRDIECLNLRNRSDNVDGKKSMLLKEQNQCVMSCPNGYTVAKEGDLKDKECVKCDGFCPKECNSTRVNSIQDAQRLHGCSKIIGPLFIQIMGGSNVAEELENNLGDIREVTAFINIRQSYALLNLHFFRSLEIIGGEQLIHQGYSLMVMDNSNLQELFPEENMKKMTIRKGNVSFHGNRKLCKYKIDEFVSYLNLSEPPTEHDISPITNGDLKPCMTQELKLNISMIYHNAAVLEWDKDKGDERNLLTYMINYKEIKDKNVNIHQGRDACSNDVWTIKEQTPSNTEGDIQLGLLPELKPYTMYAVYVQAYTLSTATHSAMTDVQTFITDPYYPSEPRDLKVTPNSPTELHVAWKPPKHPNGNVTYYKLAYLKQIINPDLFEKRNYCSDPVWTPKKEIEIKEEEKERSTNRSANCCACPKSKEELAAEARKKEIEVYFENYLQNNVFCKRYDKLPPEVDPEGFGYTIDELADGDLKIKYKWVDQLNKRLKRSAVANDSRNYDDTLIGTVEVFGLEAVIGNLDPFSTYIIEVQACHSTNTKIKTQLCSNQAITAGRTKAIGKLDMINESTIVSEAVTNTSSEIVIKWDPPSNPNGLILMYKLFFKRARSNQNILPREICISQGEYRTYNGCLLTGLDPGNWTFQINAISLAGNLSKTSEHYFIIPNPPGDDGSNSYFTIAIIIVVPTVIFIVVMVVWFVAKNKFRREDMTVISQNMNYLRTEPSYVMDGWEVERDKIKLVRELGQGSFGMVYEGTAIGLGDDPEEEIRVAVKTVNDRANFNDRREFLKEATTMKAFDCYHVVKLLGVVSHGQPALVIMELMALGDLKNYLREHRPDEHERPHISPPRLLDILQMAGEIADGMAYLAAKKFVHRDLAARNCMVDEHKIVKIGDFGMTRDIYETDYYRKGGKGMLPVRWMAPESLKDGVFTTMSDVWSYGVVMWEMVTLAAQPYQGLSNEGVVKFVSNGNTMDVPDNCPQEMSFLMERCWAKRPKSRPTFMDIIEYLLPNLNDRFTKVSYFFNEGGGPADNGLGGTLRQPTEEGDYEQEHEVDRDVGRDLSGSASSLEGASAPPLCASCERDYPVDHFQVSFLCGQDQNSVMHQSNNGPYPLLSDLPQNSHKNSCYDSNLDGSFEGDSFISDGDDSRIESDSSRSFIRGDYQSVPLNMLHSVPTPPLSKENNEGLKSEPTSGVIELQPLISCDKPSFPSVPFSLPSPNSDQSKAIFAPKYSGYQSVPCQGTDGHPGTSSKSQSSSHQKPQLTSAFPLTHARMERPVPHDGSGTSALRPLQSLGASSSSSSSSSSPSSVPPLLPSTSNAPSRPTLRLPVLNQPPGGGFHRVPLFNSGSRDKSDSQRNRNNCQPTSSGDACHLPGTDCVEGESQQMTTESPLIVHSSILPHQGTVDSTSSDGSKESNKSAENFPQMNGLTNGYVWHKTAPC